MKLERRLVNLAQSARLTLAASILFGFAAGILIVLQARQMSWVISRVFLSGQDLEGVRSGILGLLGVILVRGLMVWGAEMAGSLAALRIKTRLRQELFEHILNLGPMYARQERAGELINTCLEGVEALDAYFSQYLPQIVLAALVPLAFLTLIFPLDPLSGIVLLFTAPLIPVFMVLVGSLAEKLTEKQWDLLGRISAYFYDVLQGLTTLKTFGRSQAQGAVLEQVSERHRKITMSVLRVTFLSALSLEMIATLSTALVAVEIGLRLLYGRLTYEQALFVLLLAPEFYQPLRTLGARFHAGMAGVSAAGRIFSVLEEQIASRVKSAQPGERRQVEPAGIYLQDVTCTYPDGTRALESVTLSISAGQRVALVGASGAGKSTIAAILLGFIAPESGEIYWNGQPLSSLSPEIWRRDIAWVPQHPYLFHDTVLENIRLARPEASLEEVIEAARRAHAHDFILELPEGYETVIGERGARLSGGQAQRISLARAFLKDAPLLVLDESTSNLDPEQETLIQESIQDLMHKRTTLVIAHRLNTVYRADKIYVMHAGRIVEVGRHEELIQKGGLYCQMVESYTTSRVSPAGRRYQAASSAAYPERGEILPRVTQSYISSHDEPAPRISVWRALERLLHLLLPHSGNILGSVLFGFLTVGSGIGLMATSAYIISAAALQPSIAVLQVPIVGVRFFGIGRGLFRYLERYTSHQTTFKILSRLRVWFYRGLEPLAPARLITYKGGDLLSRVIGDIASLESFYVRGLAPPLVAVVVTGVSFLYLSSFSPRLGVNLLAFLLLAGVGAPLLGIWATQKIGQEQVRSRGELSASLADGILGLADLLAFGQEHQQASRVNRLNQRWIGLQTRLAAISALQSALLMLLSNLAVWVSLMLAIPLVHSGEIQGVYLAVVSLATLTSFEAVSALPLAAQYLGANLEAARRLFEIIDAPPVVREATRPLPAPRENTHLEVVHLSFRYPTIANGDRDNTDYTLRDVSLDLPPGKRLAVVGPSGAGKSTLVRLLLRYWDYEEGSIRLGGEELLRYASAEVRNLLSVVEQNPFLFNTTIRENLLIGRPDAAEVDLIQACQAAQIYDFIRCLPAGFETRVGEGGMRLSGGERQRLAIARALLRRAPLLVLDEPTANLDPLVERKIWDAIVNLKGRTILLITHRLTGMEAMDEILVLSRGKVVERGRHHELLQASGMYRRMWDLQNQILG